MISSENSDPPVGPPVPSLFSALPSFFSELTTISVTGHSTFSLPIERSYLPEQHAIVPLSDRLPFVTLLDAFRGRNRHSRYGRAAWRVLLLDGFSGVSDQRHFIQHMG